MPYIDLHDKPFDDGTISKLEIFEDYAKAWLPTFIMQDTVKTICIFDFFAGTGYDLNGVAGSPIRILQKIKEQIGNIFQKDIKIKVFFNEFEDKKKSQNKFELLKKSCVDYLEINKDVARAIEITYYNEDFKTLFFKLLPMIKSFPSLVYLDQNGIQFLSNVYVSELEKTKQTDFLYFVSSSYFMRFGDKEEFKKHFKVDMEIVKSNPYRFIHRIILEQLKLVLPSNTKLRLYPFSIKKGANIHGIIFGASHPRAVDKFLNISWKKNEINGEANFDIDEDAKKVQLDFFEPIKLNKIQNFQENVKKLLLTKKITNNFDLYNFTIAEGHIGKHADTCLREMKKNKEIIYESISPLVTYENVYKNKKKLEYKNLNK